MRDPVTARWLLLAALWVLRVTSARSLPPPRDVVRPVRAGSQLLRDGCLSPAHARAVDWRQAVAVSRRSAGRLARWCATNPCRDAVDLQRVPGVGPAGAARLARLICRGG